MPLTENPRPKIAEASAAIMRAVEPFVLSADGDIPAALSALATVMALVSAGRAFLAGDDRAAQEAAIAEDEAEIVALFGRAARAHLDKLLNDPAMRSAS